MPSDDEIRQILRADQITATARAVLDARDVIKRAQDNGG